MIYLDHAATTSLDPKVEAVMRACFFENYGNPSSLHETGRRAKNALDEARDAVADFLGARSSEILFTSGGTEANNLAIKGISRASQHRHLVLSAIEHPSVLESAAALEREGFQLTKVLPDREGRIDPNAIEAALTPDTALVAVMVANNEVGTVQPIEEIGRICRARGIPFHADAVQAAGDCILPLESLEKVDSLSLSAHKLYGPKGIGALFVRSGTRFQPLLHGGGQEGERRAGTENLPGIVGFAEALRLSRDPSEKERIRALRDRLQEGVLNIPGSCLHGHREARLSNNLNVGFEGVLAETLLMALDLEGVCASAGSACSAGALEASHVLLAMGLSPERAREAIRLTVGRSNTFEQIEKAVELLARLVARLRR